MRIKGVDKPALKDAWQDKEKRLHGGEGPRGFETFPIVISAVITPLLCTRDNACILMEYIFAAYAIFWARVAASQADEIEDMKFIV